jgi:hypothetical protein
MHPAKAAILNTALEPLWQRLRQWVSAAMHNHEHSRDQLTHEELAPIRTAIFEIEALLRRLVLVAATAVTLDITARWSPPPKTDAKTRAKQSTKRIVRAARRLSPLHHPLVEIRQAPHHHRRCRHLRDARRQPAH